MGTESKGRAAGGIAKRTAVRWAFTLVELLVVIATIALLRAILLPTLQRVRRQAKALVCRSNLRQWGVMFSVYTQDNNQRFFAVGTFGGYPDWCKSMEPYYRHGEDLLFCPMATRHEPNPNVRPAWGGGRDSAWDLRSDSRYAVAGSYGANGWIRDWLYSSDLTASANQRSRYWQTCLEREAHQVPVLLDAMFAAGMPNESCPPPDREDVHPPKGGSCMMGHFCVNRHDGCENGLFMDWAVRTIGLKELWTLKWHRQYDTRGRWTWAGGVQPEDWPGWMRRLRDY